MTALKPNGLDRSMMDAPAHPAQDQPLRLLTLGVALTLLTLGWLSWAAIRSYHFVTGPLPAMVRLEELRGQILLWDEILTMSARMSAATGNPQWEARYRRFDPQLDQALKEVRRLVPEAANLQAVAQTDAANAKLVAWENRAFELVRQGQLAAAQNLLAGIEYEAQKQAYAAGMSQVSRLLGQTIVSVRALRQVQALWGVVTAVALAPVLVLVVHVADRATVADRLAA